MTVHSLRLVNLALPLLTVEVECGKGFYMRALAHDLGSALGVGGHLSALCRTAVGRFAIASAVPLERVVARLVRGDVETLLHAPDAVIADWPALILERASVAEARHGRDLRPAAWALRRAGREGERARGYGADGRLVALFEASAIAGAWHPYRVFSSMPVAQVTDTMSQPKV